MRAAFLAAILLWLAAAPALAGGVMAERVTYKPEFRTHSEALATWFRRAPLTPEASARISWIKCCEIAERVHTKFRPAADGGDGWAYRCTAETRAACGEFPEGAWKEIPADIIHREPIAVPEGYDPNDPRIA